MHQVGALAYRRTDSGPGSVVEVLLITSARSGRWIVPKGNVDGGMRPHLAAAKEAEEEGGVRGRIAERPIGSFCYGKERDGAICQLEVDLYPLEVSDELAQWPEMSFRDRQWLLQEDAAKAVGEPDLASMIRSFRP